MRAIARMAGSHRVHRVLGGLPQGAAGSYTEIRTTGL